MFKKKSFFALLFIMAALSITVSCKKVVDNINNNGGTGSTGTTLYDSMYLYAQQVYYWNTDLPPYNTFNPDQYKQSNDSAGLAAEMFAYTRYAKSGDTLYEQLITYNQYGNPVPNNSTPKYSQLYYTTDLYNGNAASAPNSKGNNLAMSLNGQDNSFGLMVGFVPASITNSSIITVTQNNRDSTVCFIRYVITNSPAYQAGLRRGDIILTINGQAWDYDNNLSDINNALFSPSATNLQLSVYDPYQQDTLKNISLQTKTYTFNPIFKSEVLTYGSHKIAYLSFLAFTDNAPALLDSAFQSYASQGATDIVVDLRYNGGGDVSTAEHLVNLLAPSSANNKTMFTEYYNQTMQKGQATLLKNVPIDYDNPSDGNMSQVDFSPTAQTTKVSKAGSVTGLTHVYFIVSSSTASASEIVINCLSPYVSETQLSAWFSDTSSFTYGKPVGFFDIRIGNFTLWTPEFETRNANGYGNYYQGLQSNFQANKRLLLMTI